MGTCTANMGHQIMEQAKLKRRQRNTAAIDDDDHIGQWVQLEGAVLKRERRQIAGQEVLPLSF